MTLTILVTANTLHKSLRLYLHLTFSELSRIDRALGCQPVARMLTMLRANI